MTVRPGSTATPAAFSVYAAEPPEVVVTAAASLSGVTGICTVCVSVPPRPSETWYVKESVPSKSWFGV